MASYSYCAASCMSYMRTFHTQYVWIDPNVHDSNNEVCK